MTREDIIKQAAEQASQPMRLGGEHRNDLAAGYAILRETPIIRVHDFEEELKRRVQPTDDTTTLKGKRRTRWENRTDWVKSDLTRRGLIRYFELRGDRYILFARPCGEVNGTPLIPLRALHELITHLGTVAGLQFTT